ncbi:MAG TPA: DNA replication and repair protein RecF [Pyrinomonadaceae bacterium]|nr:DNA replication and repair protein RecF [Pyrinomonadaceae bacterium]
MLLEELHVRDFRNLTGDVNFGPGLNILIGDNGQGKTNWLEAVYILATTRSFKTAKLQEAVRFGEEMAIIRGRVRQSEDIIRDMQAALQGNTKTFLINGKRESVQQYLGQLHAVVFNSDELEIVRGQPDSRRRFLDGSIVAIHPPFVQTITDYNRVLKQKNSLLQSARDNEFGTDKTAALLAPWNEQLVQLATKIHRSRVRIVERLNEALERNLFGTEEITIRYVSSLEGKGDLADYEGLIAERLALRVQAETVAGHALIGTHRDDLEILLDGHDIRRFGSAGQQRSALLMLQLANIAIYHAQRSEYPLFLLDDIDAELDYHRIGQLLEFLHGKTQTLVTTSKENFLEQFGKAAAVIKVEPAPTHNNAPPLLQPAPKQGKAAKSEPRA